jgi:hypothetical protein
MAVSTGTHSYSTTLSIDPAGGTSYTLVVEVKEMNGPGMKITQSDRTNLSSPGAAREKTPGLIDQGQLTMKLNFTKVQYAAFLTMLRKALGCKITYPLVGAEVTASTLVGLGSIAEIGQAIPEDDIITNDVTIEATGLWVFTAGV